METSIGSLKFEFFTSDNTVYGTEWCGLRLNDDYHRLYFVAAGEAEVTYNNLKQELIEGHVYLLPTTSSFDYSCSSGHFHLLNICFKLSFADGVDALTMQPYVVDLTAKNSEYTHRALAEIGTKMRSSKFADQLRIQGLMLDLLSPHFHTDMTDEFLKKRRNIERFKPAMNYIHENISNKISVGKLSQLTHMSRSYFAKKFSDTFQVSAQDYVRKHRVEQVKRTLRTTNRPISLLAEDYGYSSASHMTREFKIHTGHNPKDYRNLDLFYD